MAQLVSKNRINLVRSVEIKLTRDLKSEILKERKKCSKRKFA